MAIPASRGRWEASLQSPNHQGVFLGPRVCSQRDFGWTYQESRIPATAILGEQIRHVLPIKRVPGGCRHEGEGFDFVTFVVSSQDF